MVTFEDVKKMAAQTAQSVAKKSGEIVEATKLKLNIFEQQSEIDNLFQQVGRLVYDARKSGSDVSAEVGERYDLIDQKMDELNENKQKLIDLKQIKVCGACDEECSLDAVYCDKCGNKF